MSNASERGERLDPGGQDASACLACWLCTAAHHHARYDHPAPGLTLVGSWSSEKMTPPLRAFPSCSWSVTAVSALSNLFAAVVLHRAAAGCAGSIGHVARQAAACSSRAAAVRRQQRAAGCTEPRCGPGGQATGQQRLQMGGSGGVVQQAEGGTQDTAGGACCRGQQNGVGGWLEGLNVGRA